jgi:hypothetical protein
VRSLRIFWEDLYFWFGVVCCGIIGLVASGVLTTAQTLTVQIKPNTPFTVQWDQKLEDTFNVRFRWWCNGVIVKNFTVTEVTVSPEINQTDRTQTHTAIVPGLPAGMHSCLISSFNDISEEKSAPIPLTTGTGPTTPVRVRVVVDVKAGGGG